MRKYLLKSLVLFIAAMAVMVSCSKDDAKENEQIDQNGGEVFRYQAVTINLNGVDLSQNEYEATFAGEQVILKKSGVNTLIFAVSPNAPLGKTDLVISSLNSATIHYDVKDTALTDTPENTLSPFLGSLDNYTNEVGVSTFPEYQTSLGLISAFNSFYTDADAEQKEVMAKLYKANKASFDYIMMSGINGITGRFTPTDFATVSLDLFRACVEGVVIGAAVIGVSNWFISNPPLFTAIKIVGAVLAGVALGLCAERLRDFLVAKSNAVKLSFSSLFGTNDRSSFVSFQNDVSLVAPINTYRRSVDMSDAESDNTLMTLFFGSYAIYNDTLNTINNAIDYINNYNPFDDIPNLVTRQIPVTSQAEQEVMTQEIFQKLELSVNHPNLEIVSKSLQSNGQLNMKIKIIGTPSSLPVESFLNYSYSDEFSSFSGTLPIKVGNEELIQEVVIGTQTWMLKNLNVSTYRNGDIIPQVQDPTQWRNLTTGAWCYYENNSANGPVYGKLYNRYAVNDSRGLAPVGWHIPSDDDWLTLVNNLGGINVAGDKMKEVGSTHWTSLNANATNSSGFTGLGCGFTNGYGFLSINEITLMWSSSPSPVEGYTDRYWVLDDENSKCKPSNSNSVTTPSNSGYSVRCMKD
ncbi:hypothetical protein FLJC2902T_00690 [Flavobacterium limnosediminis JC2902]|uniref:Fibrobacter succinogenes major paralogous domain-containing protein n=1 Tax=Flavobacterium limnosediminis JC2902 TaxID=1341181 RepID=V6ST29_9FLAO|nr:fibrobacter succinogenes major paralogous domain-containing protein [Flavobacterium limnosediminis]ESU29599.1 hypothetical protein FLJC2902T_00690 [Flavobacterium limnosediminis JC2902]